MGYLRGIRDQMTSLVSRTRTVSQTGQCVKHVMHRNGVRRYVDQTRFDDHTTLLPRLERSSAS